MTCEDTATGLLPCAQVQRHHDEPPSGLSSNCVLHAVGTPVTTMRHQGTHFTGHGVQKWVKDHNIDWCFHLPYNTQGARLTKGNNGLPKDALQVGNQCLQG